MLKNLSPRPSTLGRAFFRLTAVFSHSPYWGWIGIDRRNKKIRKNRKPGPSRFLEGLDYTWNEREGTIDIIAKWMNLNASQAGRAYDSVRDTYSKNGIPSDEQVKAYIAMLGATAGLKGDVAANSIFDFSLAAEAAKEMTGKK